MRCVIVKAINSAPFELARHPALDLTLSLSAIVALVTSEFPNLDAAMH
jgi:hypothetical protein